MGNRDFGSSNCSKDFGYLQNYWPLWVIDDTSAPNMQGCQNGTLILGITYLAMST